MTPEQLKASLLQIAMKGRITEQLESDGNASELLPLLKIDPKIIANDPPFDIPENWMWIAIGNLGETTGTDSFSDGPFGSNLKTVHYITEPEVRIIQLSNIGESGWKDQNVKYTSFKHLEEVIPRCEVHPGDFVIAKMMPAGRTIEVPDLGTRITLGSDAMKFVPNKILDKKYLLWAMRSQAFLEQVYAEAHGITRVRTTLKSVKSYVLPIPPLEEQHRIVAKIEEMLPYIDRYAEAYEKLEQFNAKFPRDMKKSILQYAIQGKLVEQRAEEGTAEELYQQIQGEKQRLIKEGKIKKEKHLAEISEDEIPFDIPESWKWYRFGDVIRECFQGINTAGNHTKFVQENGVPIIQTGDMSNGIIKLNSTKLMSWEDYEIYKEKYQPRYNDIFYCNIGTIGKPLIYRNHYTMLFHWNIFVIRYNDNYIVPEYLKMYLEYITSYFIANTDGTAMQFVSKKKIINALFPLPPIEEQHRIVAKIEELLPYCDRLVK